MPCHKERSILGHKWYDCTILWFRWFGAVKRRVGIRPCFDPNQMVSAAGANMHYNSG